MKRNTFAALQLFTGLLLVLAAPVSSLQGGPVMPEYVQFSPADAQDMVNPNTGNFGYTLPLGEVPGPYGGYPLSMSYQAGIGPNQEATWVGLGWTLNPGAINRTLRGVPDDQFHGGELAYLYSYTKYSGWSTSIGWSYGVYSVNMSFDNLGQVGLNMGIGIYLATFPALRAGVTFGTDGIGLTAGYGFKNGVGINGSIGINGQGKAYGGASVGVSGNVGEKGTVSSSIGVHKTTGQDMSFHAGVGFSPKSAEGERLTASGAPMVDRSSGLQISDNRLTMKAAGYGTTVSVPGSSIGMTSSNGAVYSNTDVSTNGAFLPTPIGVFSLGVSRWSQENWVGQATSEYAYGYMYQGGPAIFADAETDDMETAGTSGTGTGSLKMWTWNYKGKSLDRVGNPMSGDLLPGYDLFSVAANGISGTFRAQALSRHSLYQAVEKLDSRDSAAQTSYYLLDEDNNAEFSQRKQWNLEFPADPNTAAGSADFTKYAYDYCLDAAQRSIYNTMSNSAKLAEVAAGRCSRYAVLKSRHLNEANRLVVGTDRNSRSDVRSRMVFRFMGENGGYYTSESPTRKPTKYDQFELDPQLFNQNVDGTNQGLLGSRRIEPLLELGANNKPRNNGRLQGFKITNPDGTQFFFDMPVRSIISADYTTNRAKGGPLFVDQGGTSDMNTQFRNMENMFASNLDVVTSDQPERSRLLRQITNLPYDIAEGIDEFLSVKTFWDSPKFRTACELNEPDSQYNFSYSMKINPYATQWLLTEIRGPEFVLLDEADMAKNIGYQVKFTYEDPYWYKWRFPFAPPMTPAGQLPNFRLPRNAATPEDCNSDVYHGSFGVKEMVYLKSIETATHKAEFVLNDPDRNSRMDGKGWIQDWTGRTVVDDSVPIPTAMPIYVTINLKVGVSPVPNRTWTQKCEVWGSNKGETCWWERDLRYTMDTAFLNMMPTEEQAARMIGMSFTVGGLMPGGGSAYKAGYAINTPMGFGFAGLPSYNLMRPDDTRPVISGVGAVQGLKLAYGSTAVAFSPVVMADPPVEGRNTFSKNKNVYRTGMVYCSTPGCTIDLAGMGAPPLDTVIPSAMILGGNSGDINIPLIQPLTIFSDFVETKGRNDNQVRFLDTLRIKDKVNNFVLRKYEFKYENTIQPGTLNSYPLAANPDGTVIRDGSGIPDFVTNYPTETPAALAALSGKLKLKSVQEFACGTSDCAAKVPLPPFSFFYKNENESPLKLAETFMGTIVASSTPQDEWGYWNKHATAENKKVDQDFATFGAVSWSMDKVVDPAGGALEIEYERDTFKGENYSEDFNQFPVSWKKCPTGQGYDDTHLCIDLLPRRWKIYCNRDDQLEGEWDYKTGTISDEDYAYMSRLFNPATDVITNPDPQIYFQLDGNARFLVRCGARLGSWRSGRCSRHRSVGTVGNGKVLRVKRHTNIQVSFMADSGSAPEASIVPEVRTMEIDVPYSLVEETLAKASKQLTGKDTRAVYPLKGIIWIKNLRNNIKGGDIRVSKLIRRDIGLTQTTKYDYSVGEMATYPDSVLSTAFSERFSPTKAMLVMPTTYLPGISRVPGIGDEELAFLPGSNVTYPKVTVTNITSDGSEILNGKTEYEFIGPESGVPQREGGVEPFAKVALLLAFGPLNIPAENMTASLRFRNLTGGYINIASAMTRVPGTSRWEFEWVGSSPTGLYRDVHSVEITLSRAGSFVATGTASLPQGQVLGLYGSMKLTGYQNTFTSLVLNLGMADWKSAPFTPILVRTNRTTDVGGSYIDYTSFLGKPKATAQFRWFPTDANDRNIISDSADWTKYKRIKQDTIIYSSVAPSGDDRFYADGQARRLLIGQDEEKWEYMRKIRCNDDVIVSRVANQPECDFDTKKSPWFSFDGIDLTVDAGKNYRPKQMTYSRRPAFVVETVSKTGFNGSTGPDDYIVTRTTNHRIDPVTGAPTLSVTYSGPAALSGNPRSSPAKALRSTPAYIVNTPLAPVMFERNLFTQQFREDTYTWPYSVYGPGGSFLNFDQADLNDPAILPPHLTAVKITPFTQNLLDITGTTGAPRPILAKHYPVLGSGEFTARFKLTDAAGQAILANNPKLFTDAHDSAFLRNWSGVRIVGVTRFFQPKQKTDIYGVSATMRYEPTGFHQIGAFKNARYDETAVLVSDGMAGRLVNGSDADAWRFSGGSPVLDKQFIGLTGNFNISNNLELTVGKGYTIEGQFYASAARTCQVSFFSESPSRIGDSKPLALPIGLSTQVLRLDAAGGAYSSGLPGAGLNRVRLSCSDGGGGTVKIAYLRAYPEESEALTYLYDVKGNMVQSVNEQAVSTYYEYDVFSNLAAMRNDDGVLFSTHKRELVNAATP